MPFDYDILDLKYRTDVELVVTGVSEHIESRPSVIRNKPVVTFPAEYHDLFDCFVIDDLEIQPRGQRGDIDIHQAVFISNVRHLKVTGIGIEMANNETVTLAPVIEPAGIGERRHRLIVFVRVVDSVELYGVIAAASLVGERIDSTGSGIVDVEELLAGTGSGKFENIGITPFGAIEYTAVGPPRYFKPVGSVETEQPHILEDVIECLDFVAVLVEQNRVIDPQTGIRQFEIGIPRFDQRIDISGEIARHARSEFIKAIDSRAAGEHI